jgi:hypothetical protein
MVRFPLQKVHVQIVFGEIDGLPACKSTSFVLSLCTPYIAYALMPEDSSVLPHDEPIFGASKFIRFCHHSR